MFTLIALGSGAAYSYSVAALLAPAFIPESFRGHGGELALYFEPAAVIVTLILLGQVLELLATLPRNQREVVYLRFQGGLSYREISAVTGLSVSNVGFLLHTAVRAIRSHLRAETSGAGHDYSSNRPERPQVDRIRTGRTGRG
jgi:hypothetical protein